MKIIDKCDNLWIRLMEFNSDIVLEYVPKFLQGRSKCAVLLLSVLFAGFWIGVAAPISLLMYIFLSPMAVFGSAIRDEYKLFGKVSIWFIPVIIIEVAMQLMVLVVVFVICRIVGCIMPLVIVLEDKKQAIR